MHILQSAELMQWLKYDPFPDDALKRRKVSLDDSEMPIFIRLEGLHKNGCLHRCSQFLCRSFEELQDEQLLRPRIKAAIKDWLISADVER